MSKTGSITWVVLSCVAWSLVGCGSAETPPEKPGKLVQPEVAGVLRQATELYGPLVVRETPEEGIDAVADIIPWSGYWYPYTDDILVAGSDRNGGQSTLDKYDRYVAKALDRRATSVDYEIQKGLYIRSDERGWQGRCNAAAFASVMEPEPVLPPEGVTVKGVTFFTRDVKALMIKAYERVDERAVIRFGERFFGYPMRDRPGTEDLQDVYPDQFHRVIQAELFEKGRPILMDSDAGNQVWNKAIWWAMVQVHKDPSNENVMHVTTWVKAAMSEDPVGPDYVGTKNIAIDYNYDLFGYPQPDGSFQVVYGKWTGKSVDIHPDYLTALPAKGVAIGHRSENEQLELDVVYEILERTGALKR